MRENIYERLCYTAFYSLKEQRNMKIFSYAFLRAFFKVTTNATDITASVLNKSTRHYYYT